MIAWQKYFISETENCIWIADFLWNKLCNIAVVAGSSQLLGKLERLTVIRLITRMTVQTLMERALGREREGGKIWGKRGIQNASRRKISRPNGKDRKQINYSSVLRTWCSPCGGDVVWKYSAMLSYVSFQHEFPITLNPWPKHAKISSIWALKRYSKGPLCPCKVRLYIFNFWSSTSGD